MARGRERTGKAAGLQRLALLVLGLVLLMFFIGFAIAEGIGDPSIPDGSAAVVEDVPGDIGDVTIEDVEHSIELAAAQAGEKEAPKPGDAKYDELKETGMKSLLEGIWIQGVADEWGIEVSDQEVAKELKKIKKESFKSEAEFQKFLKESHYTPEDVNLRVEIQMLSGQLQEQLKEKAPKPTRDEIENYYAAAKSTQYTQKPSRDVRLILNKDEKKAQEAFDALSKDNSAANWSKVAKKYSEDPTTKLSGGLRKETQEGTLEEPLDAQVFETLEGRVEGPVKVPGGYYVFEVVNSTPESTQELKAVEAQIQATLTQRLEQEYFTAFVGTFNNEWTSRTFCADGYVIERCANYKGSGHPSTAPATCYEADPKGDAPEACPAPVFQLVPALPGTVSPLEPQGRLLAQRSVPAGGQSAERSAAESELAEGLTSPPAE